MPNNPLANPLQALLAQAAEKLPQTGQVEKFRERLDAATDEVVILCDISSSMAESAGARRKIDLLQDALDQLGREFPQAQVIAFNSLTRYVPYPVSGLPEPEGGTALHLALEDAQHFRPRQTIVVSDGRPDSEQAALEAASRLTGKIDVIYCGPDSDREAIEFMQRLARANGGRVVVTNWTPTHGSELAPTMRRLLALPEPRH